MKTFPRFSALALASLLLACGGSGGTGVIATDVVEVQVHNTATRPVIVTVTRGDASGGGPILQGEHVAVTLTAGLGLAITVTVTAPEYNAWAATTASKTCTPKAPIIDTGNIGIFTVQPVTGGQGGITLRCIDVEYWNEGT